MLFGRIIVLPILRLLGLEKLRAEAPHLFDGALSASKIDELAKEYGYG